MDSLRRRVGPALAAHRTLLLAALALVVGLACAGTALPKRHERAPEFAVGSGPLRPLAAPATFPRLVRRRPAHRRHEPSYLTAWARHGARLRSRPGGPAIAVLSSRTEYGRPRVVSVARRRGPWLGVVTSALPNGKLGWLDSRRAGVRTRRIAYALRADLSRRTLELRRRGRLVRRLRVGIGSPGAPTPAGRFAVTDKLRGSDLSPTYGCCILAFSGYQTHLPAGWKGGNRLATHGAPGGAGVGGASSAGCLRASDRDLRWLMRRVPVGTPVFVRR